MMDNPPRRHHYVPAFYLARFTVEGRRDGRLFVFDQSLVKSWASTPDGTAHQRDFYAVDLGPEVHPATFESKVLAEVDGRFSAVVHKVVSDKQVPTGVDLNTLLNFVASTMARIPRTRQLVNQAASHVAYESIKRLISTDEGWKFFLSLSSDSDDQLSAEDAETFRRLILEKQFDITLDNTSHVQEMVELVGGTIPILGERRWSVGFAAANAPDFVCSDAPVSLVPNERFCDSDQMHLAHRETTVMMPLSRRAVLVGAYDRWPASFQVTEGGVLSLNSYTIRESTQVFSATENFTYVGGNGQSADKDDLIKALKSGDYKHSNLEHSLGEWLSNYPMS